MRFLGQLVRHQYSACGRQNEMNQAAGCSRITGSPEAIRARSRLRGIWKFQSGFADFRRGEGLTAHNRILLRGAYGALPRACPRLWGRSNALPQKTTGTRTNSVRMPAKGQILRQLWRYSFSPVSGFKNSVPSCLILLKLNIWVMELASASNEPWPMRCPLSQLSSTKRMIEVWSVTL